MKNLIYQVWAGELRPGCKHSSKLMKAYADRIGADYRLDIDPNIASAVCDVPMYFEWLNPMLDDSFLEYDNVLVVDLDIFPTTNCRNIFEEAYLDVGICTEPFQGKYRASTNVPGNINMKNDERWASEVKRLYGSAMPRDVDGYLKVYNAGMVLFSNKGLQKCREKFETFQKYINYMRTQKLGRFYTVDQNYFHAMMVTHSDYTEMQNGWNSYIHYTRGPLGMIDPVHDSRNAFTKFVHVQLSGADYFHTDKLYHVVNSPRSKW